MSICDVIHGAAMSKAWTVLCYIHDLRQVGCEALSGQPPPEDIVLSLLQTSVKTWSYHGLIMVQWSWLHQPLSFKTVASILGFTSLKLNPPTITIIS